MAFIRWFRQQLPPFFTTRSNVRSYNEDEAGKPKVYYTPRRRVDWYDLLIFPMVVRQLQRWTLGAFLGLTAFRYVEGSGHDFTVRTATGHKLHCKKDLLKRRIEVKDNCYSWGTRYQDEPIADGREDPVIIFCHGWGASPDSQAPSAREAGCAVVSFNYRGYNNELTLWERLRHMPKCMNDLVDDAIDVVQSQLDEGKDPNKIMLSGHSMGGIVAIKAAAHFHRQGIPIKVGGFRTVGLSFGWTIANFIACGGNTAGRSSFITTAIAALIFVAIEPLLILSGWEASTLVDYLMIKKSHRFYTQHKNKHSRENKYKEDDSYIHKDTALHKVMKLEGKYNRWQRNYWIGKLYDLDKELEKDNLGEDEEVLLLQRRREIILKVIQYDRHYYVQGSHCDSLNNTNINPTKLDKLRRRINNLEDRLKQLTSGSKAYCKAERDKAVLEYTFEHFAFKDIPNTYGYYEEVERKKAGQGAFNEARLAGFHARYSPSELKRIRTSADEKHADAIIESYYGKGQAEFFCRPRRKGSSAKDFEPNHSGSSDTALGLSSEENPSNHQSAPSA